MFYLRTLDDTAWSIADVTGPIGTGTHIFDINFTANDQEFTSIRFVDGTDSGQVYFDATLVNEYPRGGWVDAAYQNVKIAGGVDATNPSLLSWFRQNAKNLTPSNDDASITKALQDIAEAISGRSGGGGMPADYPYEVTTLFEGNVEYEDDGGELMGLIAGLEVPRGRPVEITINGVMTNLYYIDDNDVWSDSYPYDPDNETIALGYTDDEASMFLWMKDASVGTYAVRIEGDAINENFENAVKEIAGESSSEGVLMIHCDGAATIQSGRVIIPTNCTLQDISTCFDQEKQIFIKPIFVHLPVVENIQTGEYSYSDNKSAVYLVQSVGRFLGETIITIGGLSYGVIAYPQGAVFVWASENIT